MAEPYIECEILFLLPFILSSIIHFKRYVILLYTFCISNLYANIIILVRYFQAKYQLFHEILEIFQNTDFSPFYHHFYLRKIFRIMLNTPY